MKIGMYQLGAHVAMYKGMTHTAERRVAIRISEHDRREWSRMAQAAYNARRSDVGHRYSAAAARATSYEWTIVEVDALQRGYRAWLMFGEWPVL